MPLNTFTFVYEIRYKGQVSIEAPNAQTARLTFNELQLPNLQAQITEAPQVNVLNLQPSADFSNY